MTRQPQLDAAELRRAVDSYGSIRQLGREIAESRLDRRASDKEAEAVRRQVQKWLEGGRITQPNLTLLARALQVPQDTLVQQPPKDPVEVLAEEVAAMRDQIGRIETLLRGLAAPQAGLEEGEGR